MDGVTAVKINIYDKNDTLLASCVPTGNGLSGTVITNGAASKVVAEMSDGQTYPGRVALLGGGAELELDKVEMLLDEVVAINEMTVGRDGIWRTIPVREPR